ncbi:hypothetical protein BE20_40670 [Sorangium cellulosum]|nr:hypothetical protein BE20_40670 [Sorangium cellulosum]
MPRAQRAIEQELAHEPQRVAGLEGGALDALPADLHGALAQALDAQAAAVQPDAELLARQAGARERRCSLEDAGALAVEDHPPAARCLAASEDQRSRARLEERDLTDALRLGGGPGDQERRRLLVTLPGDELAGGPDVEGGGGIGHAVPTPRYGGVARAYSGRERPLIGWPAGW